MIEIDEIYKSFGGIIALDGCSFRIRSGKITGLIGPNGAGKTTLFNILAGFIKPSGGHVRLDGRDVTGISPNQLFHMGLVRTFQIPREFTRMTVLENLMLVPPAQYGENVINSWLLRSRVRRQESSVQRKAEEVLDVLQLGHLRSEYAGNLSGGQKKLLEFGRTMMPEAKVILLDEPGAGINPTLLAQLAKLIRILNEERGYTFCIIEHNIDLIAELCDPVVVMAQGQVLAENTMAEIRRTEAVRRAYLGGTGEAPVAEGTT